MPGGHPMNTHDAHSASDSVRKQFRWPSIDVRLLVLTSLALCLGTAVLRRNKHADLINADYSPALESFPAASPSAISNNAIARMGLLPNLDGMAVLYPDVLKNLISDGRFRTDLPLPDITKILNPGKISDHDNAIDPDAPIFSVIIGTLSEESKAHARGYWMTQQRNGLPPNGGVGEFTRKRVVFTLNNLKQPDDERKLIIEAILRAELRPPLVIGYEARAIGVAQGEIESGSVGIWAGSLPPVPPAIATAGSGAEATAQP
jgi:hypothetical protein